MVSELSGQGVIGIPVTRDALLDVCDWQIDLM